MGTLKTETVVAGNYAIWPWESDYKPKLDERKIDNIKNRKKVFGGWEWEYDGTNVIVTEDQIKENVERNIFGPINSDSDKVINAVWKDVDVHCAFDSNDNIKRYDIPAGGERNINVYYYAMIEDERYYANKKLSLMVTNYEAMIPFSPTITGPYLVGVLNFSQNDTTEEKIYEVTAKYKEEINGRDYFIYSYPPCIIRQAAASYEIHISVNKNIWPYNPSDEDEIIVESWITISGQTTKVNISENDIDIEIIKPDSNYIVYKPEDGITNFNDNTKTWKATIKQNDSTFTRTLKFKARCVSKDLVSDEIEITQAVNGQMLIPDCDYFVFTYNWGEEDGTDLDSCTYIEVLDENGDNKANIPFVDKRVGFNFSKSVFNGSDTSDDSLIMKWCGDNQNSGAESAILCFKNMVTSGYVNYKDTVLIHILANWYRTKGDGDMVLECHGVKNKNGTPRYTQDIKEESHGTYVSFNTNYENAEDVSMFGQGFSLSVNAVGNRNVDTDKSPECMQRIYSYLATIELKNNGYFKAIKTRTGADEGIDTNIKTTKLYINRDTNVNFDLDVGTELHLKDIHFKTWNPNQENSEYDVKPTEDVVISLYKTYILIKKETISIDGGTKQIENKAEVKIEIIDNKVNADVKWLDGYDGERLEMYIVSKFPNTCKPKAYQYILIN